MKPKKFEPVNYIQTKQRKPLWIASVLILIAFIVIQMIIILKCITELTVLYHENKDLNQLLDTKKSQVSDLEENCKDLFKHLEELKYENN